MIIIKNRANHEDAYFEMDGGDMVQPLMEMYKNYFVSEQALGTTEIDDEFYLQVEINILRKVVDWDKDFIDAARHIFFELAGCTPAAGEQRTSIEFESAIHQTRKVAVVRTK